MQSTDPSPEYTQQSPPSTAFSRYGVFRIRRHDQIMQPYENITHTAGVESPVQYGETAAARTIFTVIAMICLLTLGGMLGNRAKNLRLNQGASINYVRLSILLLYVFGIFFVFAAAVVEVGLGLATAAVCRSAIYICLTFYMMTKAFMYIFLIERIYILRSPYSCRTGDKLWLTGMLTLGGGFGAIAVIGLIWPMSELSHEDGKCRIGLPLKVSIPLLTFDVVFNIALTGVFIYLIRPLLSFGSRLDTTASWSRRLVSRVSWALGIKDTDGEFNRNRKRIKSLLWKSLIGTSLILLPTMANLSVLYAFKGRELGWLCFTVCSIDITWGICIVHWLTMDPLEGPFKQGVSLPDSSSRSTSLAACGDYAMPKVGSQEPREQA